MAMSEKMMDLGRHHAARSHDGSDRGGCDGPAFNMAARRMAGSPPFTRAFVVVRHVRLVSLHRMGRENKTTERRTVSRVRFRVLDVLEWRSRVRGRRARKFLLRVFDSSMTKTSPWGSKQKTCAARPWPWRNTFTMKAID